MAVAFTPIQDTLDLPAFSVGGASGIPYSQILNSLGSFIYIIDRMRIVASSFHQLTQPVKYSYKDANGNYQSRVYAIHPDRNYKQPVEELKVDMVFNGKSNVTVNILGGQSVTLFFYGKAYRVEDYMAAGSDVNKVKKQFKGIII